MSITTIKSNKMLKNKINVYKIKQFILKNIVYIFLGLILFFRFYYPDSYLFLIQGKMYFYLILLVYFLLYQDNLISIELNMFDYLRRPNIKSKYKITRYKEFFINTVIFCMMFIIVSFVPNREYIRILLTVLLELSIIILIFAIAITLNNKIRTEKMKSYIFTAICTLGYAFVIPSSLLLNYETKEIYYHAYGANTLIVVVEIAIILVTLIYVKEKTYYE